VNLRRHRYNEKGMATSQHQFNVSLTPHFTRFIRSKVKSGRYADASEVVRDALRRLEQEEVLQEQAPLLDPPDAAARIQEAVDSVERGDYIDVNGDEELRAFFSEIVERGKKRLGQSKRPQRR
jgi:antitoxin ParD1/3/4